MGRSSAIRREVRRHASLRLRSCGVSPDRGFLGSRDPMILLPRRMEKVFAAHMKLGEDMPELMHQGGNSYMRRVAELPLVGDELAAEKSGAALLRLAVTVAFLTQAYVWEDRHNPRRTIPAQLAVPMYALGRTLGVAPLLIYQFYTLANWRRVEPAGPITVENVRMLQNFNADVGNRRVSEEWFVGIHVEIERVAGDLLHAAFMLEHALNAPEREIIIDALSTIEGKLNVMERVLARMNEYCDPETYYAHVRPYLFGWYTIPNGVVYEGVPELFGGGQLWRGQTGAQSSVAPLLDTLLSIPHMDPKLSDHLGVMLKHHTPTAHRALIGGLVETADVRRRTWAKLVNEDDDIHERYCRVRRALADFRRQHYDHALVYIAAPAMRELEANKRSGTSVIPGTGGSDLIRSLKLHIAETLVPDERKSVMEKYEAHWHRLLPRT